MTAGYFRDAGDPEPLRGALKVFRDLDLGTYAAAEVVLCEIPFASSTFLRSWRVVRSVALG